MNETARCRELRELIDTDVPADELARLAWVDALLRAAAAEPVAAMRACPLPRSACAPTR